MEKLTWHEPLSYKKIGTVTSPSWLSLVTFVGVTALILVVYSLRGKAPDLGWPTTSFIAVVCGATMAYVIPFITRFGNRVCSIDENGVQCDELVGTHWRNRHWDWQSLEYCALKRVLVGRKTHVVLLLRTTAGEEHSLGLNAEEVDPQKIESAVLRNGCALRNA
jgi:hypothetical protein